MNKYSNPNSVIQQALIDYQPNIVSINSSVIEDLIFNEQHRSIHFHNQTNSLSSLSIYNTFKFLISLNSINYQFWSIQNNQLVRYQNHNLVGALAMFDGFSRLFEYMVKINFDTNYLTLQHIQDFFGDIPVPIERLSILKESFDQHLFNDVLTILEQHIQLKNFNVALAKKISNIMPISYHDPYLKKIQLCLYEMANYLNFLGYDIKIDVTVAADYQIPKVLEHLGVLTYSNQLIDTIQKKEKILSYSDMERAIRSATILSCEDISQKHNISIACLDRFLWLSRNDCHNKNFHLTETPYY